MEQQTVTISKAGIHTSLNARCSVLAAANPVYGRYDPYQTPMENIGLPDSLLSRFDLLFIMLDKMDPQVDRFLAGHVLRSHCFRKTGEADGQALQRDSSADVVIAEDPEDVDVRETPVFASHNVSLRGKRTKKTPKLLNLDFCKKYILYCKAKCHPVLTPEAAELIAKKYADLRSKETDSKSLPVTARTLECMIRLSTAHAKSRLSETITVSDAEDALALVNFAYYNEAQKKDRNDDGKDFQDDSSDDDDDDADESQSQSQSQKSAPSSAKSTPKRLSPEERKQLREQQQDQEPTTSASPKGKSPAKAKTKKGKEKASDDPFDFEDDEDASSSFKKPSSKSSKSPASKKKTTTARGGIKATTPEPEPTVEVVTTTPEQATLVRNTLSEFFTETRTENTSKQALHARVEKAKANFVSMAQLSVILDEMQDNNDVMVVDDQILKI